MNQIKSQAGKALKYAQDHPRKCVAYTLGVCSGGLFAASIGTGNDPTNSIPKGKSIYATGFGIGGVVVGLTAASVARKGEIIEHASVHGVTDERAREHLSRNVQNVRAGISRAASSASVNLMSQFSSTNNLAPLGNRPPGPLIDAPTATISGSVGVTVPGIADDLAPVPLVRTDISAAILPIGLNTVPSTGGSRQGSAQINPVTPPLPGAGNEAIASNTAAPNTEGATSSSGFIKTCKNAWGNTCKTTESVVSSAAKRMSWRNPEPPNPVRRSLGYID